MKASILFWCNYFAATDVIVNQGGTSSGKTYAVLQALFCFAANNHKQIITVVGQDIPNLKSGALRDAHAIHDQSDIFKSLVKSFNKTDRIFEFINGSGTMG
ncbi:hypothetical protein [Mucilaginibacter sp. AK015]|uniref:hypothetical protein n=1 Tax=Mucilaginibacter sp. AK015 TaxID=2723072 RepID=UPI00161882BD|nr:hypothetical protein [Mucilaginibacter sp. AK015]MBB5395630.1 Rad3-related DNA helicase [Mucilaginibacter sp. AK015]